MNRVDRLNPGGHGKTCAAGFDKQEEVRRMTQAGKPQFMKRRTMMAAALTASVFAMGGITGGAAFAQSGPIRIGEINSYKAQPAFLDPYKKGMDLAVEEVNAAGGVNGR
jgi:hypothetical protein